jgi:quercetin dioxygenase-like cupin family protein
MLQYSSKDFGKTRSEPVALIPEKLKHAELEKDSLDADFSNVRKHPVFVADLPSRTMCMTIGHLAKGQKTRRHRHTYETLIYIMEGVGRTTVEDRVVEWKAGDAIYVPVWAWHNHENLGNSLCRYVACENAPLLQNIAGVALREEE